MRIAVGNDHAAMEGPPPLFKPEIVRYLREQGHTVVDCGTNSPESVDYPDLAQAVCATLLAGEADAGILMCGTGIGMSIAANRNPGIRAAVCATPEMARLSREHNNANVLCFGKRILSLQESLKIIDVWLATPFSEGERHVRRVCKMG
ncbi:MAG TPA: ribose 5-phosphate isomerase B [Candidatus Hydrogenedentes bacterium]|jgi:ribose 5-phosphate isomerase B|nr:ribose 5-phosphate isomerase B [Candidatus Hydrogenedentota bacterium]MDY0032376.1 ribose 5-phosphate isomerase B [FCB group bacterium]NLT59696.1 ribose 5-phosphate isomerase B [Candidatus Hydrogenedentota bacterium]HNZ16898.1 ribose 5-phosphate isomerase B [Candidatus Hydrogenedentota bacterium]HOH33507.1 ribose 5-phosphate isomerase B [Candidatus Hydrogenedentota bacterium]